ncbi:MAG: hypothetical protein RL320_1310 [Pseudomonadota bacterium]|jgi:phosphatidylserine decarboxylase
MPDIRHWPHPIIAREGWAFLAGSVFLALVLGWVELDSLALLVWVFVLFVLQFFRDPARVPPPDSEAITSPADGQIVYVGAAPDPFTGADSLKISVFMNVFNVHSNRAPIQGRVGQVAYSPGKFVNAALDKASSENERNAVEITDDQGRRLSCVQVAGLIARRILCYVQTGDRVDRGMRYGFIRFGSRVDVFLPVGSQPLVAVGQKVSAHATALAHWPQAPQDAGHE